MLQRFPGQIQDVALEPSSGGCFEVTLDGDLVHSKLATGSFPAEAAIIAAVQQRLG